MANCCILGDSNIWPPFAEPAWSTMFSSQYSIMISRALRTDLHSAVLLGGEDGSKAGNKELLKRLYNICH